VVTNAGLTNLIEVVTKAGLTNLIEVFTNAGLTVFNFFSVIDIMKKDLMPKIGFGLQLNSIFNGF
jgi:hypothetical protein